MKKLSFTLFVLFWSTYLFSQIFSTNNPKLIVRAGDVITQAYIAPSQDYYLKDAESVAFSVNFVGSWPVPAKAAFNYAVSICEKSFTSSQIINVKATWTNLGNPDILGQASAGTHVRNFGAGHPAYENEIWFPLALAEAMDNSNITDALPEIEAEFNSGFSGWYYGTDGNTPLSKHDFTSVVLHELMHGLGFSSSAYSDESSEIYWGLDGYPTTFDRFIVNGTNTRPTTLPFYGSDTYLTSNNLFLDGVNARSSNGGNKIKVYSPASFEPGSSISHFDENQYDSQTYGGSALMTL